MNIRSIQVSDEAIAAFCKTHGIQRLALFGSVIRDDFRPESDIDVLVEFNDQKQIGLSFIRIQDELSELLGRSVDLHTPQSISRYFRDEVLKEAKAVYVAA